MSERLLTFLTTLADLSAHFSGWRTIDQLAGSSEPLSPTQSELERALEEGRAFGRDRTVLPEFGYETTLWTGSAERPLSLRVNCAISPNLPPLMEEIVLRFPGRASGMDEIFQPNTALHLMRSVIACWQPEWAFLSCPSARSIEIQSILPVPLGWWFMNASPWPVGGQPVCLNASTSMGQAR
jgi:hypothetical protein